MQQPPHTGLVKTASEKITANTQQVAKLKKLVSQGESQTLEFKRKAAYPEKIVREMIAFANTNGGTLLLGVSDDRTIPGLKFPEEDSFVIKKMISSCCRPGIPFSEALIQVASNRFVIRYDIRSGPKKPYILRFSGRKESFIRVGDKTIKTSPEMREILKKRSSKRDNWFTYGEHEQLLFAYLVINPFITVKEFSIITGLNRFKASRKLVRLVLANVLKITPTQRGDQFSLISC
ncbi:MAG: ATP-binding protein [Flammeovirgaceae bacterium]|nr:MAG: ATP-binding protein [Flammeovirgaceae bacterium]